MAAIGTVAVLALIGESRAEHDGPFDVLGVLASVWGLAALVWGLIEAPHYGWSSVRVIGAFIAAVALLTAFVARS